MSQYPILTLAAFLMLFTAANRAANETARVAKSSGAKQCESGRVSLAAAKHELAGHGIKVVSGACGDDGLMHPAVCGAETGEILIFEIPSADLDKAKALGFKPLSGWPEARETPCPDGGLSSLDEIPARLATASRAA